jgi:uncharacterized HhH-GPD family protein
MWTRTLGDMTTTARTTPRAAATRPRSLPFTGDEEADRLLAEDANAMLIGFVLDQQVTVQKAFHGPLDIRGRVGTLDPREIAAMPAEQLAAAFAERPAIHRFPTAMAQRVQALCAQLVADYGGHAERIWTGVTDADELWRRLSRLPGFGEMKARTVLRLLEHQYGVHPAGIEALLPKHPTLGDVTTAEELDAYQTQKRAHKAKLRAEGLAPRRPQRAPR